MNKRLQILALTIALGVSSHFQWLPAEESDTHTKSDAKQIVPENRSEATPAIVAPAADPNEAMKDPLYKAIRDQLNDHRPSLIPIENQNVAQSHLDRDDSITPAEWKAIELILRSARILERAEKHQGTNQRAENRSSTAKQLRAQAMQILRRSLEP